MPAIDGEKACQQQQQAGPDLGLDGALAKSVKGHGATPPAETLATSLKTLSWLSAVPLLSCASAFFASPSAAPPNVTSVKRRRSAGEADSRFMKRLMSCRLSAPPLGSVPSSSKLGPAVPVPWTSARRLSFMSYGIAALTAIMSRAHSTGSATGLAARTLAWAMRARVPL